VRHVAFALVIALCSCKKSAPRPVVPPSVEEAEAFGKDFAAKLAPCDAAAIDRVVDLDLLIARGITGGDEADMRSFKRGFGSLGDKMCKQLTADTTVTYLRTQQEGGAPRPLLRLIIDGGMNYYQLELDKRNGVIRLADFYIYLSGEKASDTLKSMMGTLGRTGLGAAPKLKQIRQAMQEGRWLEAHTLLQSLPAELRAAKSIMLMETQITSELGDEAYLKALNAYAKAFPSDPSLALVAIDRAILRKEYDVALQYMKELDARVGGDAYLDALRAGTLQMAGRMDEALAAAKRATEREPTLQSAWWQLLTVQTASKRYTDAIATVEVLRDKFAADITTETLRSDDRFTNFVDTAEYIAWDGKQ
jgi:tetratricopeptide (TPR) repeat protein